MESNDLPKSKPHTLIRTTPLHNPYTPLTQPPTWLCCKCNSSNPPEFHNCQGLFRNFIWKIEEMGDLVATELKTPCLDNHHRCNHCSISSNGDRPFPGSYNRSCGEFGAYEGLARRRWYGDLVFNWVTTGKNVTRKMWTWWGGHKDAQTTS